MENVEQIYTRTFNSCTLWTLKHYETLAVCRQLPLPRRMAEIKSKGEEQNAGTNNIHTRAYYKAHATEETGPINMEYTCQNIADRKEQTVSSDVNRTWNTFRSAYRRRHSGICGTFYRNVGIFCKIRRKMK